MFSSAAGTGGNPGQSNYTAANAYLQSLAQKRHTKGLAASTIHIGATIGVGYLARRSAKLSSQRPQTWTSLPRTSSARFSPRLSYPEDALRLLKTSDVTTMTSIEIGTGVPPVTAV
ncbi:hypothetical protein F5883DRAFT_655450 [Diaporthe sp. PMI_573]|nr:hypothetical protein F5883DRAFT_655450 [Diaporthaceae sp. PMI_573]